MKCYFLLALIFLTSCSGKKENIPQNNVETEEYISQNFDRNVEVQIVEFQTNISGNAGNYRIPSKDQLVLVNSVRYPQLYAVVYLEDKLYYNAIIGDTLEIEKFNPKLFFKIVRARSIPERKKVISNGTNSIFEQ